MAIDYQPQNMPWKLLHQGKVRDVYQRSEKELVMVATDRLSAFDVILPDPIPHKGRILTRISNQWFKRTESIIQNHLLPGNPLEDVEDPGLRAWLEMRTVLCKKLEPLPVEAIVRGYIIGSGWKDYQATGQVSGIALPSGLKLADALDEPVFTPSTKAEVGDHDENIDFERMCELIGEKRAEQVRAVSLKLYRYARDYAEQRGIIIADTKFEFGLDEDGELILMDEILTPDSSRFWPADQWQPGSNPPSFDKQFVRDYLETLDWDKTPPGPRLPEEIIRKTAALYQRAEELLFGQ